MKDHILVEIKRTAQANGGVPLGRDRFYQETGIKISDWEGKYWARWSDAIREAGLKPNKWNEAYNHDCVIKQLIVYIRELGRFPVNTELRLRARQKNSFPSHNTIGAHLGRTRQERIATVWAYCSSRPGFEDVLAFCPQKDHARKGEHGKDISPNEESGFVYLLRSGRYHKIERSNAVGRRERELAIQLPEKANVVHSIRTDDPAGIEAYWHRRFAGKRKNGEWFELTRHDIDAFKRRKFM